LNMGKPHAIRLVVALSCGLFRYLLLKISVITIGDVAIFEMCNAYSLHSHRRFYSCSIITCQVTPKRSSPSRLFVLLNTEFESSVAWQ